MKTSNITASSTEVEQIAFSGKTPPRKRNEIEEPADFNDDDDDFDLPLDTELDLGDELDLDDDEY